VIESFVIIFNPPCLLLQGGVIILFYSPFEKGVRGIDHLRPPLANKLQSP
jgi:hypothetical protein